MDDSTKSFFSFVAFFMIIAIIFVISLPVILLRWLANQGIGLFIQEYAWIIFLISFLATTLVCIAVFCFSDNGKRKYLWDAFRDNFDKYCQYYLLIIGSIFLLTVGNKLMLDYVFVGYPDLFIVYCMLVPWALIVATMMFFLNTSFNKRAIELVNDYFYNLKINKKIRLYTLIAIWLNFTVMAVLYGPPSPPEWTVTIDKKAKSAWISIKNAGKFILWGDDGLKKEAHETTAVANAVSEKPSIQRGPGLVFTSLLSGIITLAYFLKEFFSKVIHELIKIRNRSRHVKRNI